MPSAEIIAIGSELLLGETLDTNTQFLLQNMRQMGIDVFRTLIIGDNAKRISVVIQEALERADIVITTGGLGPTIDDPTREAVSLAFGCELKYKDELWVQIQDYFSKMNRHASLNNKRQAYIPACGQAIANPVGTAPAFYVWQNGKFVVSLPGVPQEMKYLFSNCVVPLLLSAYTTSDYICMRILHSFGIGESSVDELVGKMEESANPTLGLSAKLGQIDLRITAKAPTQQAAEEMVDDFDHRLREKLGNAIFGVGEETLHSVVEKMLQNSTVQVRVLENNTAGKMREAIGSNLVMDTTLISSEAPEKEIHKFLESADTHSIFLVSSITSHRDEFIRTDIYGKHGDLLIHEYRSYNPLSFDEKQPILLGLNILRLILLQA